VKKYTRNEWRRCETTLETSGEDVKTTLETSGEDVNTTLETSGEDVKLHSKRVEKIISPEVVPDSPSTLKNFVFKKTENEKIKEGSFVFYKFEDDRPDGLVKKIHSKRVEKM
jgi:hypothetical protein